jgi:ADP-ribose pyrophosphatase YjhB (NUDIX family)
VNYSFCPKCGHALEQRPVDGRERLVCVDCRFVFYQNPKPCASVLVLHRGQLLLVRRGIEPYRGWWDIPGGFLEADEHPEAGAIREVQEETGLLIRPVELLGIFMDTYGPTGEHTLNLCYVAELLGGQPRPASDVTDLHWFDLEALPDKVAFGWSQEALERLKQRYG